MPPPRLLSCRRPLRCSRLFCCRSRPPYRPFQSQRILEEERRKRGDRCEAVWDGKRCEVGLSWNSRGQPSLEFAHVDWTGLVGRGRGGTKRAYDIRAKPHAYKLVCRRCHTKMDRLDERDGKGRWYPGPAGQMPETVPAWVTEKGEEAEDDGRDADGGCTDT